MNRDLYLDDAAELRRRLAKLPATPPDVDAFLAAERQRIGNLSEAELLKEWQAANDLWFEREQEKHRLDLLRDRYSSFRGSLQASVQQSLDSVRKNMPPILAEAIQRIKREIENRESWGRSGNPVFVSDGRGNLRVKSNRTEAHDRASERARLTLHELESLVLQPGDITARVKAILTKLCEDDLTDLADVADVAETTTAAPAAMAVIEAPSPGVRRERLSPVG
jgi:hypothetical protein